MEFKVRESSLNVHRYFWWFLNLLELLKSLGLDVKHIHYDECVAFDHRQYRLAIARINPLSTTDNQ